MIKNPNLESKLDELFKDSINGYSEEYLSTLNTIIADDYKQHLTIHSVALVENQLECIFIDRFNLKFVTKVYDLRNLLTQWNYLKYDVPKLKEVIQTVINYTAMNAIFTYVCTDVSLVILNAGPDNLIILPSTDIYPILSNLYGTAPPHTIIKPVTLTKEPNLKEDIGRQPIGPITTEEKSDFKPTNSTYKRELIGWGNLRTIYCPKIITVQLSLDGTKTYIELCETAHHTDRVVVEEPFNSISRKLYNRYKADNRKLGKVLGQLSTGVDKITVSSNYLFKNKSDEVIDALVTVLDSTDARMPRLITGYLTGNTLAKYVNLLKQHNPTIYDVV